MPEINGANGNRIKMLKNATYTIMARTYLANFTYSGKTVGHNVKLAFQKFKNVKELLYGTVSHIDCSYSASDFHFNSVNKVLKYAYE